LINFVFEHTDNFVAHGFPRRWVEMDFNPIGRFADGFHKVGLFGSRRCGGGFICIHIDFLSALFALYGFTAVLIHVCVPTSLNGFLFVPTGLPVKLHKKTARKRSKHVGGSLKNALKGSFLCAF
jgi:hypothetical protein